MLSKKTLLAAAALTLAPLAAAGPFKLTLPVEGIGANQRDRLIEVCERRFDHNVLKPTLEAGEFSCHAGAEGPRALVRLSDVRAAIEEVGGTFDRPAWTLKAQEIGLSVSAEGGISIPELDAALAKFPSVKIEVLGSVLDGSSLVRVVHFDEPVDLAALEKHLSDIGVTLDDLVWGHWKYGWKIEDEHDSHGHDNGAVRKGD